MKRVKEIPAELKFHEYLFVVRKRLDGVQTKMARASQMPYYKYMDLEKGVETPTEATRMRIAAALTGLATKEQIQMNVAGGGVAIAKAFMQNIYLLSITAPEMLNLWLRRNGYSKKSFSKKFKFTKQSTDNWSCGLVLPDEENRAKIEKATKGDVKKEYWE